MGRSQSKSNEMMSDLQDEQQGSSKSKEKGRLSIFSTFFRNILRRIRPAARNEESDPYESTISTDMDKIKSEVSNSELLPFDEKLDPSNFLLDKYFTLGDTLGRGSFGNVHWAHVKGTKHIVAVKKISRKMVEEWNLFDDVKMEADVHKRLCHPYIVRFFAHFQDEDDIYFVLEFMPHSLAEVMKSPHHEDQIEKVTAIWMAQLIDALIFCHQNHIVHMDVKMENVLLDRLGNAKLIDFGLARPCKPGTLIDYGQRGSPYYFSPEILSGNGYDARTDIWSLGVLCYECLVGRTPFEMNTLENTYKYIRQGRVFWPLGSPISPLARDFVGKLLEKDMNKRMTLKDALQHEWITTHKGVYVKDIPTDGEDPDPDRQFTPMTDEWWLEPSSART